MYRIIIILIFFLTMIYGNVYSQTTVESQANAEIIDALSANEINQLHFGRFAIGLSGGQIIITPTGERTSQGSITLVSGSNGPGRFQVNGFPDASFVIQLPESPAVLVHQGTNKTMIVDNWDSNPSTGNGSNILNNGSVVISIGGTLTIGNIDQNPIGIYSGTFQLTFSYN